MIMMWEWGNGADSSRVRTSAAGLLESGGERRFGVVLLCLRVLEWNKEKREEKTEPFATRESSTRLLRDFSKVADS